MNGLDLFSPSTTVDSSTGYNGEDDDWGEFVDSSPNPNDFSADRNGPDSSPNRIESKKKSQAQWVNPRGPVPLSVFGEEEEEEEESGAPVSSFKLSFDSFSGKHNDGTGSVNKIVTTNPTVEISGLIANLYRENEQNEITNRQILPEINGNVKESLRSRKLENSGVSWENLSWNPLNLDRERTKRNSNVVNSNTALDPNYSDLSFADRNDDDDEDADEGWEFKTAESMSPSADRSSKEEQGNATSVSVVVQKTTDLNLSIWSSPTNGTDPNFDTGETDAIKSVFDRENGDDDPWDNGGWEFKVADTREPKKHITNKVSEIKTTTSFQSNFEKDPQKKENGSISFSSNANLNSIGTSWAFDQPSLETGDKKEEKEMQPYKPKGILPLSFFEDETMETSDTLVHEDSLVSVCDFSVREKTKAPSPVVSITDLISSLYSQVEKKNAANLSEKSVTINGEDDSWEFQGPIKTITDSRRAAGTNDFDSSWEFQGPSRALKNSDVTDEFDDDSWEFQGPTQPVKDYTSRKEDNDSLESKQSSLENEVGNQFSVPNGFGESHEKTVSRIEPNDYQDVFHKLKTELYYLTLNHLVNLKEARDLAADSDEVAEAQKYDDEIQELQNMLNNDILIGEVNVESLLPRSSGITELFKALLEPKFQAAYSEELLSERLLVAVKDLRSTMELLKHAMLTLKILNLGSHEQQSKYASAWFLIASTCAQELRHASSIWKQVIGNDVQEEILSKPQGKSYVLSVGEIFRVVKVLRASTRLYKPWILLSPTSSNLLAVLDECVEMWLSSGLEEALRNSINRDRYLSADQLLESLKCIDKIDAFTLHTCITTATSSPTCYISGLNTEIVPDPSAGNVIQEAILEQIPVAISQSSDHSDGYAIQVPPIDQNPAALTLSSDHSASNSIERGNTSESRELNVMTELFTPIPKRPLNVVIEDEQAQQSSTKRATPQSVNKPKKMFVKREKKN